MEDLKNLFKIYSKERIFLLRGDLNEHVESITKDFEGIHEGYDFRELNVEDKSILEFLSSFDFTIANI